MAMSYKAKNDVATVADVHKNVHKNVNKEVHKEESTVNENTYTWTAKDPYSGEWIEFNFETQLSGEEDKRLRMMITDYIQNPKKGGDFWDVELTYGKDKDIRPIYGGHIYPEDVYEEVKRVMTREYYRENTIEYLGKDAPKGYRYR